MKPLPDLTDDAAMIRRGRQSALMSARNEAAQALRDAAVAAQSCKPTDVSAARAGIDACKRLIILGDMFAQLDQA